MSISFSKVASQADFTNSLDDMLKAVNEGQLLTEELKITSKNTPCFFFRNILHPFMSDSFGTFRTNRVAASLLAYAQANKDYATKEIIVTKALAIVEALDKKTANKYAADLATTKQGFEMFEYPAVVLPLEEEVNSVVLPIINQENQEELPSGDINVVDLEVPLEEPIVQQRTPYAANATVTKGINNFGFAVHSKLAKGNESFCFSPVTLAHVADIILQETKKSDVKKVLNLNSMRTADISKDLQARRENLLSKREVVVIATTADEKTDTFTKFIEKIGQSYALHHVSEDNQEAALEQVNSYISQTAGGEIEPGVFKDLKKGNLNFSIIHATSLKETLQARSTPDVVLSQPFTFSDGQQVTKDFATLPNTQCKVFAGEGFTMIEIPYVTEENASSMSKVIFLPNSDVDFDEFQGTLTSTAIAKCREQAEDKRMTLVMPLLSAKSSHVDMLKVLKSLGLKTTSFADQKLSSVLHYSQLIEEIPEAEENNNNNNNEQPEAEVEKLAIDRSYYYFVMNDKTTLMQGQVDDASLFLKHTNDGWV
ncbi:MAG: hypothetical protein JSR46_04020 [Verrucomicrobia bacterium]|nr:hypothetical protein [Verrucomicrobiota bacterium]